MVKTSILTSELRKHIAYPEKEKGSTIRQRNRRIRDRVRAGLKDFRYLADDLDPEEREKIFSVEPGTTEYGELEEDIQAAIQFLYVGLGGAVAFARPLKRGVANGEVALGNAKHALSVNPRFVVNVVPTGDSERTIEAVAKNEWDRLEPPDLFDFIKLANEADAIDYKKIQYHLSAREDIIADMKREGQEPD